MRTEGSDRPKPLYYSTASQLGFHKTRGVPGLLDALLPPTGNTAFQLLLLCSCRCRLPVLARQLQCGRVLQHHLPEAC